MKLIGNAREAWAKMFMRDATQNTHDFAHPPNRPVMLLRSAPCRGAAQQSRADQNADAERDADGE